MSLYNINFSKKGISNIFWRKKFQYKKIIQLVNPEREDKILDIGCNDGELVKILRNFSQFVDGCDINKEAIKNSQMEGLKVMPAEKLLYKDNFFDKIVSAHTIEHVVNLKMVFQEMERVLKSNGLCVLIYPFEIIRGINIFYFAWRVYGNPFYARRLHIHKLSPKKIKHFTDMKIVKWGLCFGPSYYTILKKR